MSEDSDAKRGRLPIVFPIAALIVFFALALFERRWIGDDGFINLRIASNLLEGHGFVFNLAERVEAGTSPLYLGIIALLGTLVRVEDAAIVSGIALSLLGLVFAALGGLKLIQPKEHERGAPPAYPIGIALIALLPPFWDYGTAGLELGLGLAWLGGLFFLTASALRAQSASTARALLGAALIGLGPLIRPDFALVSAHYGALWLLLTQRYWRARSFHHSLLHSLLHSLPSLSAILAAAIALPLAYQCFRMGYFASLVPNTALAKEAFSSRWDQGLRYFIHLLRPYHLHAPLALIAALGSARSIKALGSARSIKALSARRLEGLVLLTPLLAGLLHGLYIIRVGGDFMHARLLLPALFLIALPVAIFPVRSSSLPIRRALHVLSIALLCYSIVTAIFFRVDRENIAGIGDERGWYMRMAGKENAVHIEDFAEFEIDVFYPSALRLRERLERGCEGESFPATLTDDPPCERLLINDVPTTAAASHRVRMPESMPLKADAFKRAIGVAARIPIGMAGMVLGPEVHLVDRVGLADPLGARFLLERRGRPGHEKIMSDVWLYARFTEPREREPKSLRAARRALSCEPMSALFKAIMEPLTLARFIENIALAPRLHRLRYPSDPIEAEAALCHERAD